MYVVSPQTGEAILLTIYIITFEEYNVEKGEKD